ncbi:hypothetical protein VNO78_07472 [Psophocarpus tetragonolobus]|uniref:Uncharacterized protein n=1 Tax=Psophocarpus tetragonolobus TaxID=3891 RepID=A0AAN9XRQ2_PSOTE
MVAMKEGDESARWSWFRGGGGVVAMVLGVWFVVVVDQTVDISVSLGGRAKEAKEMTIKCSSNIEKRASLLLCYLLCVLYSFF